MPRFFPLSFAASSSAMVFVDGENLAIRYGKMLANKGSTPADHIRYEPDIYVWSTGLNNICFTGAVIRKYYYTSLQGDTQRLVEIEEDLKAAGIETPRVFKKKRNQRTKRVDISLATDMLMHASHRNIDIAVLIAGDEDYMPLVEAVKSEGCRVFVWFIEDGISHYLRRSADHYADLGLVLFAKEIDPRWA